MKRDPDRSPSPRESVSTDRIQGGYNSPVIIGLVGGVASGKTTVAQFFADLGAWVIDADRLCHEALDQPEVRKQIVLDLGSEVLGSDGLIDRARLRPLFQAPDSLRRLESILHPLVIARIHERIRAARKQGIPALVLDAPLLLESGLEVLCGPIVFVDTPRSLRLARAVSRGMSREDWEQREKMQKSVNEKKTRADTIIDCTKSPREVRKQVHELWELFLSRRGTII